MSDGCGGFGCGLVSVSPRIRPGKIGRQYVPDPPTLGAVERNIWPRPDVVMLAPCSRTVFVHNNTMQVG